MPPADGSTFLPEAAEIISAELRPFFDREVAKERQWLAEMQREGGVCWSGMSEVSRKPRTNREMIRDAQLAMQTEEARRQAYLASNLGKARGKIAAACRSVRTLDARLNDVGSALSRGDGSAVRKAEDCMEALFALRQEVSDMEAFVRLVQAQQ